MKLITKKLERVLPPIMAQDGKGPDAVAYVKWFTPWTHWTWYATEYDPETGRCFGLVDGQAMEMGYWNLQELRDIEGPHSLEIERDMGWGPKKLSEIAPEFFRVRWPVREEQDN